MSQKEKQKKDDGAEPKASIKILKITNSDRYETVETLFEKSSPNSIYYMLLSLSSIVVASGMILNNVIIIIGGMLIAPFLAPLLVIGLGISLGQLEAIKSASILLLKSILVVVLISFALGIMFGSPQEFSIIKGTFNSVLVYFIVAFFSGIAAAFAWARKETSEILPGVAVAVSLVPPLSMIGIGLSSLKLSALRFSSLIFIFNLIGIVLGSMVVFSLLKFYKSEQIVKKTIEKQKKNFEKEI